MDFPTALISALSEDLLFFQDGEITWNGKHHEVAGMQFNLPKLAELEQLADSYGFDGVGDFAGCFVAFLQHVEQDEALMVPRRRISSALYEPILEGDLTGITLMNLAACSKAFFVRNDAPNEYVVGFDGRLAQGIPAFFDLVCRLLWDLRQSMRSLQGMPFKVTFLQARNVDFDSYVHGSVAVVPGAQANPGTVTVESAPAVSLDRTEEAKNAVMMELAVLSNATFNDCGMPSKPSGAKASSTATVSRDLSAQAKSSEEYAERRAASNLQAQKPVETRHSDSDSAKDHQQEADTEAEALKRKELLDRAKELERYLSCSSRPLALTEISQNGSFARGSDGKPGLMALTEALGVCVNEFETVKKVEIDGDDDKKRTAYIHVNRWADWLAEKAQAKTGEEEEKREEPAAETAEAKNDESEKPQDNSDMDAPRMGCGCAIVALIFGIMVGCLSFPGLLGPILFMGVSVAFVVFFSILILMANS